MKPILFNTEMVKAILEGKKTVTRRIAKHVKSYETDESGYVFARLHNHSKFISFGGGTIQMFLEKFAPYKIGDILYVRETWQSAYNLDDSDQIIEGTEKYYYTAGPSDVLPSFTYWVDPNTGEHKEQMPWRPSIHMPKEAARIFLKVEDVRVEKLHKMCDADARKEGIEKKSYPLGQFISIWDSTIKKSDIDRYGWEANPFVWVIEFERISKEEAE